MRAVVFATAGHIDHGKTALIAALTGVNCDRLEEERRRGITIVLGFAPLDDPAGELEVSFVDVPGHERLVHTMIAGAGAVDRALLVVAADEGVMPQTREHLDVLDLLGVRGGVVAINKSDLVDPDTLVAARQELEELLAGGPLADAPVLFCSAVSGAGIAELRAAVLACARGAQRAGEAHRPFRMGLDRVFTLPGAGTVVTGTVRWGRVAAGDELLVLPEGRMVRVRGVQVHGSPRQEGRVGERVALRLAGASVAELPRGDQVLSPGSWRATRRLALAVRLLPSGRPIEEGDELRLHLLAGRRRARIERLYPPTLEPGAHGWAVLRLAGGLFAAPGDRVILRWPSPARTIGGGTVLDAEPPPLRRIDAARLAALPDPVTDLETALGRWVVEAGPAGVGLDTLGARAGLTPGGLEAPLGRLLGSGAVAVVRGTPPTFIAREWREAVRVRAGRLLDGAGETGVPVAELVSRVLPGGARRFRDFYLEDLRRGGVLHESGGRAVAAKLSAVENPLAARIEAAYRGAGFEAPSPEELARRLGAKPEAVAGLVRYLVDQRRLVRIGGKWILARAVVDGVVESVRSWGVEAFDVAQFKDRFSLTRKLAIPLLEWLDSNRVTRREGDRRRVVPLPETRSGE